MSSLLPVGPDSFVLVLILTSGATDSVLRCFWEGVRVSAGVAVTLKKYPFSQMCLKELFAKLKTEIPLAVR